MSKCKCPSMLHNHVAKKCPNDKSEGEEKTRSEEKDWCPKCRDKAKQLRLAGIYDESVERRPPPPTGPGR